MHCCGDGAASLWSGNPKIHFTRARDTYMSYTLFCIYTTKHLKAKDHITIRKQEQQPHNAGKCASLFFIRTHHISALEAIKWITCVWFVLCFVNPLHSEPPYRWNSFPTLQYMRRKCFNGFSRCFYHTQTQEHCTQNGAESKLALCELLEIIISFLNAYMWLQF